MESITQFFTYLLSQFSRVNFGLLALIDFAAFALIFALAFFGCLFSARIRALDKRAFLCIVNAFAAITLAVFLTHFELAPSVAASAVFWCLGFLLYCVLCVFKPGKAKQKNTNEATISQLPAAPQRQTAPAPAPVPQQQAAQNAVRLDHALSISDKLLLKNLGRGDRQELEKIKTTLTVMKVKGIITPQEGEELNEMFNALLKFMAKYDL